tara:strand:+ start:93822 stop:94985 length:1164 start_codon:yes stop_codon:yes gene_type:complete
MRNPSHTLLTAAAATAVLMLTSPVTLAKDSATAQQQAQQVITELGLREAPQPIREHARYAPKKVVVSLPEGFAQRMPNLEQQMQAAAGNVELVFDRSENFVVSAEVLRDADALIGICSPALIANSGERLLWMHNYLVGIERCAGLPAAQTADRVFTNNKRLSGPAIAEHSIAMLLSLARGLPAYQRNQFKNSWDRSPAAAVQFGELKGKTLLVVGLGGIGTEIAWRAHGLGMRVIATRNSSRNGPDYVEYVGLSDELLKLAGGADVIVNALPLTDDTTGLFNKAFFNSAKPGAIFISVGRGASTVSADLEAALASGRLYGAGLDVTDPEPLPADSPLWQMDNVIITPHISAAGAGSMRRTALIATENLRRYVAGEALLNIVDIDAGY